MPDITLQVDWGQAIPYKKEKPVSIFFLHESEKRYQSQHCYFENSE